MNVAVNNMKIAAIILNYNSAEDTMKCIEFLQKQKLNEELHVIVVDNSLPDYRLQITDYSQLLTGEEQSHLCQSVEQCSKHGLERAYQKKEKREYRQAGLDYAEHSEKNQRIGGIRRGIILVCVVRRKLGRSMRW